MAAKPPMAVGVTAASVPPANITSASPITSVRHASPMAWLAVAQAEQVATLGPRRPWYRENIPDPMLSIIIGMKNGDILPGPRLRSVLCWFSMVAKPPMPEPMNAPTRSRLVWSRSSPESLSACQAA